MRGEESERESERERPTQRERGRSGLMGDVETGSFLLAAFNEPLDRTPMSLGEAGMMSADLSERGLAL